MKIQRTAPTPHPLQKKYKFSYLNFSLSEIYKIHLYNYVFEDDKKDEIF